MEKRFYSPLLQGCTAVSAQVSSLLGNQTTQTNLAGAKDVQASFPRGLFSWCFTENEKYSE